MTEPDFAWTKHPRDPVELRGGRRSPPSSNCGCCTRIKPSCDQSAEPLRSSFIARRASVAAPAKSPANCFSAASCSRNSGSRPRHRHRRLTNLLSCSDAVWLRGRNQFFQRPLQILQLRGVIERSVNGGSFKRTNMSVGVNCLPVPIRPSQSPCAVRRKMATAELPAGLQQFVPAGNFTTCGIKCAPEDNFRRMSSERVHKINHRRAGHPDFVPRKHVPCLPAKHGRRLDGTASRIKSFNLPSQRKRRCPDRVPRIKIFHCASAMAPSASAQPAT